MSAQYVEAQSLAEAVEHMAAGARPIAGGTDLVVGARHGKAPLPEYLVGIHRLSELQGVEVSAGLVRLGAGTSHWMLMHDETVLRHATALADASAIVGSHATRHQGTLGGNLMNASPAMDTGAALLVLGAEVTLVGPSGSRRIPLHDLWSAPGSTTAESELLTEVGIPLPALGTGSSYVRLQYRRHMDIAVVGAGAALTITDGQVASAALAHSAVAPVIQLCPTAHEVLIGAPAEGQGFASAVERAADLSARAAQPITDVRANADYRRHMVRVMTARALYAARTRALGGTVTVPASDSSFASKGEVA